MGRLYSAIEAATVLAGLASLFGLGELILGFLGLPTTLPNLIIVGCLPAVSALIVTLICALVPGMLPNGKLAFPLPYTLPVLFCVILFVVSRLAGLRDAQIVVGRDGEAFQVWHSVLRLLLVGIVQVFGLRALVRRPTVVEPDQP